MDRRICISGRLLLDSEVESKTLGIASFYLRAVCMNRNLWGVENFEEITIRHSKFAAQRFDSRALADHCAVFHSCCWVDSSHQEDLLMCLHAPLVGATMPVQSNNV